MPPPATSILCKTRPLCTACAVCARQVRLAGGVPAAVSSRRHLSASAGTTVRRSQRAAAVAAAAAATATPLRAVRALSQTARVTAPQAAAHDSSGSGSSSSSSSPADSSSTSSSSTSSSPAGSSSSASSPPSFYALFPRTLPQGPPPAGPFAVDVRALRREFLQLQAAAHPDFHHADAQGGHAHTAARARAEAASAAINEAYRTLASPLLRAQYLLRQRFGHDLAGDESTLGVSGGNTAGSAAAASLLMTVMEAREDLEAARAEPDLVPLRQANDARVRASEAALAAAFAADDGDAARLEAVRLRYWVNIEEALREWEPGRGVVLAH